MQARTLNSILPNLIVPLSGLSIDIYTPSMPAMAHDLGVENALVKLTMTGFVTAMGLAQFFAGPISDAMGRKKMMLGSLLLFLLTTIYIICSSDIYGIIFARFVQGLAAAFLIVPGRAILNDSFSGDDLKKKFNTMTISFALAPIVAPFIGGYCQMLWNWRASFGFLLIYGLMLFLLILLGYEESLKVKKQFALQHLFTNYLQVLSNKTFRQATLFLCILFGYSAMTTVLGAFIFQEQLQVSPVVYGYIALIFGCAWFSGNLISRFTFDIPLRQKVQITLGTHAILVTLFFITAWLGVYNLYWNMLCFAGLIFAVALTFPVFVGEALSLFPHMAGSANACLFAMTWMAFSLFSILAAGINVVSLLPLASVFAGVFIVSCGFYYQQLKPNLAAVS